MLRYQVVLLTSTVLALSATAQTGRTMKLMAPVVLGQTASMVMEYPSALAGHQFAMAMCSPTYPGTLDISTPGVYEGVLRLDPLGFGVLGIGVLDASGVSPALTFLVPSDPMLVGASFDIQGADADGAGLVTLTGNDLEIVVAAPPLASLDMVAIAPGTFSMGSPAPVAQPPLFNQAESQPVHLVTITRPFWIGKYEVTQAQFQAVIGLNPSTFFGLDLPVDRVSRFYAEAYCTLVTAQEAAAGRLPTGYVYRLPTEAEWEYCCRAGTTTEWHTGGSLSCGQANFGVCVGQTSVVGSYSPNAWGLHDMHGNVLEWCLDRWDGTANYPSGPVLDPFVTTGGSIWVLRGGSWGYPDFGCRSAYREMGTNPADDFGFRIVCAPIL